MSGHVEHSPSKAKRWRNCPGSILAERGLPNVSSKYAEEGTNAHLLCSTGLEVRIGIKTQADLNAVVAEDWCTDEMVEGALLYAQTIEPYLVEGAACYVETRFDLTGRLNMPAPLAGTADCVILFPLGGGKYRLVVVDFKYGKRAVDPSDPQLLIYAMGAAAEHGERFAIVEVECVIVQPRVMSGDTVKRHTVSALDLVDWAADIREDMERTLQPDAPRNPGDWCKFCLAAGTCDALKSGALAVAQNEFGVVPDPSTLSKELIADILTKSYLLDEWIGAVRAHAQRLLELGDEIDGWKLVPKRAYRKWRDADHAESVLSRVMEDPYQPRKVMTPAMVEKAIGKKAFKDIADLAIAESSGFNLAPVSDPRTAIKGLGAKDEFAALD